MTNANDERGPESDLPVDAVTAVLNALRPLDSETRKRVLASVSTLLGLPTPFATTPEPPGVYPSARPLGPSGSQGLMGPQVPIGPTGPGFFTEDRAPSSKQFILEKRPRTDVERVACLAYYLTHFRSQSQFKTVDLSTLNAEAAQAKFSNAAQAVDNAVKHGILIPAGGGQKSLSAAGELYVQKLPDHDAARAAFKDHRQPRWRK